MGSAGASPSRLARHEHWPSSVRFSARIVARLCLTVAFLAIFASMALCCSIPVFRYALEHWKPEPFTVHIVSSTALNDSQMGLLKELKELGRTANIRLKVSDGSKAMPDESEAIVQPYRNRDSAWLVVEMGKKVDGASPVAWDGPFTKETIGPLLTSSLRQKICKGLVDQDSVSWVYLESGDPVVDDAKFFKLESELKRLESVIKLPVIDPADLKDLSKSPEELKIKFSAHRLSRDDPAEAAFVSMLLSHESDLREEFGKGTPMAFPVFGRGRVLYALLGDGISTGMIEEASRFLAGACQCTVKAENPGVDLLVAFDWDDNVQITEPKKEEDVPLTGLGAFASRPKSPSPVAALDPAKTLSPELAPVALELSPVTESGFKASNGKESTILTEPSVVEPVHSVVREERPNPPSFSLITLGALAAIVGCITIGWIFVFGPKS